MKINRLVMIAAAITLLATLACSPEATPSPTPAPIPTPTSAAMPTPTPGNTAPTVPRTPVPRSDVEAAFDKPLSSGLSVADVTENALPSVAQIIAGSGSGSGFIINEGGLVVTNKHVVEGSSRVTVRLAAGGEYQGSVTQRHPTLDLAYIQIGATRSFTPIAVGDSDAIRVGEDVIVIGFPSWQLPGTGAYCKRGNHIRQAGWPFANGRVAQPRQQRRATAGYVWAGCWSGCIQN